MHPPQPEICATSAGFEHPGLDGAKAVLGWPKLEQIMSGIYANKAARPRYDNKFWPYLAAGMILVANIRGHNHRVSDMGAGAVIGSLILNNYENRRGAQNNPFIMPPASQNSIGIALTMEF